jgi:hypothetical protein
LFFSSSISVLFSFFSFSSSFPSSSFYIGLIRTILGSVSAFIAPSYQQPDTPPVVIIYSYFRKVVIAHSVKWLSLEWPRFDYRQSSSDFSCHNHSVQSGSEAHKPFCPGDTGGYIPLR